ncbi:MAG: hypothetical protein LCH63_15315 [Candidatus Melainabacteria bacterium]|jgi:hypothetical protein|nr:hypothetical protein [Candidatus Melainabacteria bacterium]
MSNCNHSNCGCATDDKSIMLGQAANLTHLAQHWLGRNRPELAAPFLDLGQKLLHEAGATNSHEQFWLTTVKIGLAEARKSPATCVRHARSALALAARLVPEDDPLMAIAKGNLGQTLVLSGDQSARDEARKLLSQAIFVLSDPKSVSERYQRSYLDAGVAEYARALQSMDGLASLS